MSTDRSVVSRLVRFGALQAANAIVPLAVLPAVISVIGPRGWVSFAIGFSVGAAAAVAVGMAWPITGPSRVAGVAQDKAREVFSEGLAMRLMVLPPILVVACLATVLLSPAGVDPVLPCAMAVATALNGLSSSWYFIGRAEPGGIILFETIPKLAVTAAAIPVVAVWHQALAYPLLLMIASIGGVVMASRAVTGSVGAAWGARAAAMRALPRQLPIAAAGVLSTGTTALAVPVASLSGTGLGQVGSFAAATRLRTMTQAGVAAGTTALQGWVSEKGGEAWRRRAPKALAFNIGLGLVAGTFIAAATPFFDHLIFGPDTQVGQGTAIALGATCVMYGASSSLSNHVLAPAHRSHEIVRCTLVASVLSVPLVFVLARHGGATGAMWGVALGETLVVVLQGGYAWRALRRPFDAAPDDLSLEPDPDSLT